MGSLIITLLQTVQCPLSVPVKDYLKSVNIWQRYRQLQSKKKGEWENRLNNVQSVAQQWLLTMLYRTSMCQWQCTTINYSSLWYICVSVTIGDFTWWLKLLLNQFTEHNLKMSAKVCTLTKVQLNFSLSPKLPLSKSLKSRNKNIITYTLRSIYVLRSRVNNDWENSVLGLIPCAVNGSAVSSMWRATFLGTDLAIATPGVLQNRPVLTLHSTSQHILC